LSKSWFRLKGGVCPEFWFSKLVEFPTAVTHKSLSIWGHIMDHRKVVRVSYRNGIRVFWSFGQSETQKLSSVQPLLCPETEFSSEVNLQNFVTSKPLVGWSWISNRWKVGRVVQVFGIQLRGIILPKKASHFIFFTTAMCLEIQFQQPCCLAKGHIA
jgi:hypothetical protein